MTGRRLLVLGWHNVEGTPFFPSSPGAGPHGLEAQLRLLGRSANPVPLGKALDDLAQGRPLQPRAVALTFDDGYRDNLEIAAPLLVHLGLPATFFLVPGLLSGEVKAWWEEVSWAFLRSPRSSVEWEGRTLVWESEGTRRGCCDLVIEALKRRTREDRERAVTELVSKLEPSGPEPSHLFLDWDGARALLDMGFDIGSHTLHHPILSQEKPEEQRKELNESRRVLQEETSHGIDLLAYPNGTSLDYDSTTTAAARAAGYSHSVTVIEGWNTRATPAHEVRRFVVYPERGRRGLAVVLRGALEAWGARARSRRGG